MYRKNLQSIREKSFEPQLRFGAAFMTYSVSTQSEVHMYVIRNKPTVKSHDMTWLNDARRALEAWPLMLNEFYGVHCCQPFGNPPHIQVCDPIRGHSLQFWSWRLDYIIRTHSFPTHESCRESHSKQAIQVVSEFMVQTMSGYDPAKDPQVSPGSPEGTRDCHFSRDHLG